MARRGHIFRYRVALPLAMLVALASGCGLFPVEAELAPPPLVFPERQVETAKVTRGTIVQTLNIAGTVRAEREVSLHFGVAGVLREVLVKSGQEVKAGQALLRLENNDLPRRLRELRYSVRRAELELAAFDADPNRGGVAGETGLPPHLAAQRQALVLGLQQLILQLQEAESQLAAAPNDTGAQGRVQSLRAALRKAELELAAFDTDPNRGGARLKEALPPHLAVQREMLVLNLNYLREQEQDLAAQLALTEIVSPIDGVVTSILDAKPGEWVAEGRLAATVADPTRRQVVTRNDDGRLRLLAAGQKVEVTHAYVKGLPAAKGVIKSAPLVGEDTRSASEVVRLDLTDTLPENIFKLGDFVRVSVEVARAEDVLRVPSRAIGRRGDQYFVVVQEGEISREVPVEVGLSDAVYMEVRSGLEEGQEVQLRSY